MAHLAVVALSLAMATAALRLVMSLAPRDVADPVVGPSEGGTDA